MIVATYLVDHPMLFQKSTEYAIMNFTESIAALGLSDVGQRVAAVVWRKSEIFPLLKAELTCP